MSPMYTIHTEPKQSKNKKSPRDNNTTTSSNNKESSDNTSPKSLSFTTLNESAEAEAEADPAYALQRQKKQMEKQWEFRRFSRKKGREDALVTVALLREVAVYYFDWMIFILLLLL